MAPAKFHCTNFFTFLLLIFPVNETSTDFTNVTGNIDHNDENLVKIWQFQSEIVKSLKELKEELILEIRELKLEMAGLRAEFRDFKKPKFSCPHGKNEVVQKSTECRCQVAKNQGSLTCIGANLSQGDLDKLIKAVRRVNNLNPDEILPLNVVSIHDTLLENLDLTSLLQARIEKLEIRQNLKLSAIFFGSLDFLNAQNQIETEVMNLEIHACPLLTDQGLQNLIHNFSPQMISLTISSTGIQGGQYKIPGKIGTENQVEFLPGLSKLVNLTAISLPSNKITEISGGQFRKNGNLTLLNLWGNDLKHLGCDAFSLDSNIQDRFKDKEKSEKSRSIVDQESLLIDLSQNGNLTVESFNNICKNCSCDLFPNDLDRPIDLYLWSTGLASVPENIFKPFLQAHSRNKLDLFKSPLICDEKLKWLQQQSAKTVTMFKFESQVLNSDCSNDVGKSVFESSLIF